MTMAGTAMPAMRVMPTGAPIRVPSCHKIFFFLLQGFFPQKVQPDGLMEGNTEGGKKSGIPNQSENDEGVTVYSYTFK